MKADKDFYDTYARNIARNIDNIDKADTVEELMDAISKPMREYNKTKKK